MVNPNEPTQGYYTTQRGTEWQFIFVLLVHKDKVMMYNVEEKPSKKKKVVEGDYATRAQFESDLVQELQGQHKKRIKFVYGDGQKRDFGQTLKIPEYGEKEVQSSATRKKFIYEGARPDDVPYNAPRKKRDWRNTQGEDTRSLYDDPKLQKLRSTCTRKLLMKIDAEVEQVQGCQWDPLMPYDRIPESYYMQQKFEEPVGPRNLEDKPINNEYDSYKLFFCDAVYARIIKYSKEKYEQQYVVIFLEQVYHYCHGHTKAKPHFYEWHLHERELDAYFSVHLFFGIVRLSNMRDYFRQIKKAVNRNSQQYKFQSRWKKMDRKQHADDEYAYFVQQKMAQIISYNRFKEIKQFLGLSGLDAKKKHPGDPLYRVRDFITDQNEKYKKYYAPGEYLCIDEGMIPFGGKAKFKVYNPDKPTQWGIKEYLLCDAVKAYTLHVQVYHGESTWDKELKTKMLLEDQADLSSRTMELVLSLMKPYEGKGYKVVMDNYYTSWQLLRELKNRGIGALGTIRHNRTGLKKQDLVKDHFQKIYQDSYCGFAFYINSTRDSILTYFQGTADKEVAMMTNYIDHTCSADRQFSFSKKHHYIWNQKLPYVVSTYNKYKGGVDRRNAYMVNFRSKFTVRKWWQAIFERFFETALYNAFCIFKTVQQCHLIYQRGLYKGFRVNLMRTLSQRYKDYELRVKEGQEKANIKISRLDSHTYLVGEELLICEECGKHTKNFCQECTMLTRQVVGVCTELETLSCDRFHSFADYLIDKNKVVIDKKYAYTYGDPNSLQDYYKEVGSLNQTRTLLKEEQNELVNKQHTKKATVDNLSQIVSLLKTVKTNPSVTPTQDALKKLIKDQLDMLKGQKCDTKREKLEKVEDDTKVVKQRSMTNHSSDSDDIDNDDNDEMLESDAEAKAFLAEQEGASEEEDYQDKETNQFKRFQLNYERTKSLHLKNNKQKKKSKQDTKQNGKNQDQYIEECSSSASVVVDEFEKKVLLRAHMAS